MKSPYVILRDDPHANVEIQVPSQRRPPIRFERISTTTIMSTLYPSMRAVVPGYLYEGFTVLAGRQKLGKTWLAIDWAVAVATGGTAMGSIPCDAGDVLYIDMENGHRRIKGKIKTMFPNLRNVPDLSRLEWVTEAPQLDKGFIPELERWRRSVSAPTLVVIDVLQRIKPVGSMARNSYENDYSAWAPLQQWATESRVAVLGLHHTKKGGADRGPEIFRDTSQRWPPWGLTMSKSESPPERTPALSCGYEDQDQRHRGNVVSFGAPGLLLERGASKIAVMARMGGAGVWARRLLGVASVSAKLCGPIGPVRDVPAPSRRR